MNLQTFKASLGKSAPPADLSQALQGLWWDAKGDWARAHECAQTQDDADGAWVHAYLHRREGDADNAGYWYARADRMPAAVPLAAEWEAIAQTLLQA